MYYYATASRRPTGSAVEKIYIYTSSILLASRGMEIFCLYFGFKNEAISKYSVLNKHIFSTTTLIVNYVNVSDYHKVLPKT